MIPINLGPLQTLLIYLHGHLPSISFHSTGSQFSFLSFFAVLNLVLSCFH